MSAPRRVRLGHLYPAEMNIYADRGNIAVLERRLAWRGIGLEVTELGIGDPVDPGAHDLYYLGGGQDRDQAVVAEDLAAHEGARRCAPPSPTAPRRSASAAASSSPGHGYTGTDGSRMPGVGILDLDTVAGPDPADRQPGDRGRARRRARAASSASRTTPAARASARARGRSGRVVQRPRQQRRGRRRGRGHGPGDRHLPPRAAAAEEPLDRRHADRLGARRTAPVGRRSWPRSTTPWRRRPTPPRSPAPSAARPLTHPGVARSADALPSVA